MTPQDEKSPAPRQTGTIQVIDRAAALLDAISNYPNPVSLKYLSADTGLHPSTAYRILHALGEVGFVDKDTAGHYRIGRQLHHLAERVRPEVNLRQEAIGIMEQLRDQVGETVNLTVREGDQVVYVERALSRRMMRVEQVIGSRAPLHVTAVGKLMLGELGDAFTQSYAQRTGLPAYTAHTLASLDKLTTEAHHGVAEGYALDNEEAEEGVGCIGVLVHDARGECVAGLSISAPIDRRREEWVPLIREAARAISARLGAQPSGE